MIYSVFQGFVGGMVAIFFTVLILVMGFSGIAGVVLLSAYGLIIWFGLDIIYRRIVPKHARSDVSKSRNPIAWCSGLILNVLFWVPMLVGETKWT